MRNRAKPISDDPAALRFTANATRTFKMNHLRWIVTPEIASWLVSHDLWDPSVHLVDHMIPELWRLRDPVH